MYLARLKRYQPTAELLRDADRGSRAAAGGGRRPRDQGRQVPRARCTACRGAPRICFATKGIRTTWGGEPYVDQVIDYDATVVERLRDAGAVLVAKLTLGALAQGDRWFGGRTNNPVESAAGLVGIIGGSGLGDGGRLRRVFHRHRNARLDHLAVRPSTASSACVRPTGASAGTARWRSRTRWTSSDRCAGTSRTR